MLEKNRNNEVHVEKIEQRPMSSIAFGLERMGLIAVNAPVVSCIILVALIIGAIFGIQRIKIDDSLSQLFRSDSKEYRQYESEIKRFPATEFDVLVVVEGKNLLARDNLEKLRDFPGALSTLKKLAETLPTSEAIIALGSRSLVLLAGDGRPEARNWRAELAVLVEPRYEAAGAWAELAPVIRLRLDVETRPAERKTLWLRVIDIEERLLNKPELAMVSLSRALTGAVG